MTEQLSSDANNIELSTPDHARLVALLVDAYPNETAAKDLLAAAGVEEKLWPINVRTMNTFWRDLESLLSRRGQLRVLIECAAVDPNAAAYRVQLQAFLPPGSVRPPAWSPPATPLLNLLTIDDLPLSSLPEGVQRALKTFIHQRRAYEARAGSASWRRTAG